jgi:hypothetical protein
MTLTAVWSLCSNSEANACRQTTVCSGLGNYFKQAAKAQCALTYRSASCDPT